MTLTPDLVHYFCKYSADKDSWQKHKPQIYCSRQRPCGMQLDMLMPVGLSKAASTEVDSMDTSSFTTLSKEVAANSGTSKTSMMQVATIQLNVVGGTCALPSLLTLWPQIYVRQQDGGSSKGKCKLLRCWCPTSYSRVIVSVCCRVYRHICCGYLYDGYSTPVNVGSRLTKDGLFHIYTWQYKERYFPILLCCVPGIETSPPNFPNPMCVDWMGKHNSKSYWER